MGTWSVHDGGAQEVGPLDEAVVLRMIAGGLPGTAMVRAEGETEWRGIRTHAPFAMALDRGAAPSGSAAAAAPSMPPKGARRWFVLPVVLALSTCGLLAAVRAYFVSKHEAEVAYEDDAKKRRETIAELQGLREHREAQRKRIASATFRSTRVAVIDGQCLGQGKPAFGYTIDGSTYADNVLVGEAMSCRAFGSDENNITNFFCCPRADLPAAPQVAVDR